MRTRITTAFISALILSLLAGNALACGESLFRVGKGVAFRQYTAPLPGTILVVAKTESELQMVQQLIAAGHDVHVVADPSLIGDEIEKNNHQFDIVLAYFSQRDEVARQTAETTVAYLPVCYWLPLPGLPTLLGEDELRPAPRGALHVLDPQQAHPPRAEALLAEGPDPVGPDGRAADKDAPGPRPAHGL